jgi:hypothetical protein
MAWKFLTAKETISFSKDSAHRSWILSLKEERMPRKAMKPNILSVQTVQNRQTYRAVGM